MKGIEEESLLFILPPFDSQIMIELFSENGTYFVTWDYNDERVDFRTNHWGVKCNSNLECDYKTFLRYLDIRTYDNEDLESYCNQTVSFHTVSFWTIFFGVLGGMFIFLLIAWCIFKYRKADWEQSMLKINKSTSDEIDF